jgi:putative transposase
MILTYKYRLKGKRATRRLRRLTWAANQVWNFCVQTQRKTQHTYKDGLTSRWKTHFDLSKLTAGTSKKLAIHAQSIQGICEQFAKSRDQHRKCPRYRRSGGPRRSLGWVPFQKQSRATTSSSVTYLGETFRFFGAKRRPLPSTAKGGAFVEDARGNWYVVFHVEVDAIQCDSSNAVGIDLGLKDVAVLSNGVHIVAPRTYRLWEDKLIVAQRAGNSVRAKAIHAKIKNVRADFLHKLSTQLVIDYGVIVVGDVSSSKLAKTSMAKSVYDACWATFKNFLRYKASRHGGTFAEVDENFTTQRCSSCRNVPDSSPKGRSALGVREWECSTCGAIHDRDVNAAKNILAIGLSAQPLAEESRVAHGR